MPELNKRLGSLMRDMSAVGIVAFVEGQNFLISTINNADKAFIKLDGSAY